LFLFGAQADASDDDDAHYTVRQESSYFCQFELGIPWHQKWAFE
jgi:hypothetical protein